MRAYAPVQVDVALVSNSNFGRVGSYQGVRAPFMVPDACDGHRAEVVRWPSVQSHLDGLRNQRSRGDADDLPPVSAGAGPLRTDLTYLSEAVGAALEADELALGL